MNSGKEFTEQKEVTYLIRSIIESNSQKNKRLIDVFHNFSHSQNISAHIEKDYCEFALKQDVFEWFKKMFRSKTRRMRYLNVQSYT